MCKACIDFACDTSGTEIDCGQCIAHFAAGVAARLGMTQSELPKVIRSPTLDDGTREDGTGVSVAAGYCSDTRYIAVRRAGGSLGFGGCSGFGLGLAPGRGFAAGVCFGGGARHRRCIGLGWGARVDRGVGRGRSVCVNRGAGRGR